MIPKRPSCPAKDSVDIFGGTQKSYKGGERERICTTKLAERGDLDGNPACHRGPKRAKREVVIQEKFVCGGGG